MLDQTLSIYQKEGVSHAIVYYGDISKEVYDVLEKHVKSGFLEIFYWPELEILSYIRNYGQILKMNDCFYRSYAHSRYIVDSDMDEIIMPKTFYTLTELIDSYKKKNPTCGQFHFYNRFFRKNNETDSTNKYGRRAYYHLPPVEDCDLFKKIYACNETLKGKYIISTKKALALRFHNAVTDDVQCRIHFKDGHVRHTRVIYSYHASSICKVLWRDDTILKYK